jgi:hypothetical protein
MRQKRAAERASASDSAQEDIDDELELKTA